MRATARDLGWLHNRRGATRTLGRTGLGRPGGGAGAASPTAPQAPTWCARPRPRTAEAGEDRRQQDKADHDRDHHRHAKPAEPGLPTDLGDQDERRLDPCFRASWRSSMPWSIDREHLSPRIEPKWY